MTKIDEKVDELRKELEVIELESMQYKLSDAIREGSTVTSQAYTWGNGDTACALSAAALAAKARGYIE